jgi:putative endonuclease
MIKLQIMEAKHLKVGKMGEDLALKFLKKRRMEVIERNMREAFGEIDIIAREANGTLVFVEVKTITAGKMAVMPEDNMTGAKRSRMEMTCQMYANAHPQLLNDDNGWRMDLVAIELPDDWLKENDLTKLIKNCVVRYYENI